MPIAKQEICVASPRAPTSDLAGIACQVRSVDDRLRAANSHRAWAA